ncbi:MAG TPA: hypothetical protein VJL28_00045 [Gemmatimonadaceae bacterium]|nr:hypothetical protein [Gemmatimonadaceae bacterium]
MPNRIRVLAFLAAALAVPLGAPAQKIADLPLRPPDAKLAEEFSRIAYVREIGDGRLLVTDDKDRRLVVADFRTGIVSPISRNGEGPGEYRNPRGLLPLGGDSTLLVDDMNRRWLVLVGAAVVLTLPPETSLIGALNAVADGADRSGHVLVSRTSGGNPGDSGLLLRGWRATGRVDTIARLRSAAQDARYVTNVDGSGNARLSMFLRMPAAGEQGILFADGWIAIARLVPYRVEWRAPDGRSTLGPTLPAELPTFDEREKRAFVEREAKTTGRAARSIEEIPVWWPVVPPFEGSRGAFLAEPEGKLLVRRTPTVIHAETRYDVVDRRGALVGRVTMPANHRIVGFGSRSVYVAVTDDDGIQRLQRHPWPTSR